MSLTDLTDVHLVSAFFLAFLLIGTTYKLCDCLSWLPAENRWALACGPEIMCRACHSRSAAANEASRWGGDGHPFPAATCHSLSNFIWNPHLNYLIKQNPGRTDIRQLVSLANAVANCGAGPGGSSRNYAVAWLAVLPKKAGQQLGRWDNPSAPSSGQPRHKQLVTKTKGTSGTCVLLGVGQDHPPLIQCTRKINKISHIKINTTNILWINKSMWKNMRSWLLS